MKRLRSLLGRVLELDENSIRDELSPEEVPTWDSFNGLLLVSELESTFSIKFSMDEVKAVKCIGDIKKALQAHGVQLDAN